MTNKTAEKKRFYLDPIMTICLIGFMIISLLSIYASSEYVLFSTKDLVFKQLMWYGIGGFLITILLWLGSESWFKLIRILYFILLGLLFGLILVKYTPFLRNSSLISRFIYPVNGAWAWYQLPGLGSFQPSEFMKIVLVFIAAEIIKEHNQTKSSSSLTTDFSLFIKIGVWALPAIFLNFLQPDTGIPIITVFSLILLMYTAGTHKGWFAFLSIGTIISYFGIIYIYKNHPDILANIMGGGYKLGRFYGWLDYQKYAQHYGYQLYNSLLNIGVGGLTGVGSLPFRFHTSEGQTDFIFTIIGSKFGFLGAFITVALCTIFNLRLIFLAIKSNDLKAKYVISGLIGIFLIQQIINFSMVIGFLPITGITLPLISYGGSSLMSYMIGIAYCYMVYSEIKTNPIYDN